MLLNSPIRRTRKERNNLKMNNMTVMNRTDCFAYDSRKNQCTALTVSSCADCPFYKSAEQETDELKKVARRLAMMGITPKMRTVRMPAVSSAED